MNSKFIIPSFLLACVFSFALGILMGSHTKENTYSKELIKELTERNNFKKQCLDANDKCIAVIDELLDRNADTGVFDNLVDSLEANGYYKYHSTLDSLYQTQL